MNWRHTNSREGCGRRCSCGQCMQAPTRMTFDFGDDDEWQLDWDTNVAYTAQWRVAKPDDDQFRYKDTGELIR